MKKKSVNQIFSKKDAPIRSVFKNCNFGQIKYILRGVWMTLKRKRGPELTLGWLIRKSHQNAPIRFPSLFPPPGKYVLTTQRTISHGEVTNFLKVTAKQISLISLIQRLNMSCNTCIPCTHLCRYL